MEQPEDVVCSDQIFDAVFHPSADVVATGLIDGSIEVWTYGAAANDNARSSSSDGAAPIKMLECKPFKSSCRGLLFTDDGMTLYGVSSDRSFQGIDATGRTSYRVPKAHKAPINCIAALKEVGIATGDDTGCVKIWDNRAARAAMSFNFHSDFISGLYYDENRCTLLSTAGDGILVACDIRRSLQMQHQPTRNNNGNFGKSSSGSGDMYWASEEQQSELQCLTVVKQGQVTVCGTQDGAVLIFSWGQWADCSDHFPSIAESVECVLPLPNNDSALLVGSNDGMIRLVTVQVFIAP
jgi:WD40 repeat protein